MEEGQSGNPKGGSRKASALAGLKQLTSVELAEIVNILIRGDMRALRRFARKPDISGLQYAIAQCWIRMCDEGDMATLDKFLDRLIGKVTDKVQVENNSPQVIITLPPNNRGKN